MFYQLLQTNLVLWISNLIVQFLIQKIGKMNLIKLKMTVFLRPKNMQKQLQRRFYQKHVFCINFIVICAISLGTQTCLRASKIAWIYHWCVRPYSQKLLQRFFDSFQGDSTFLWTKSLPTSFQKYFSTLNKSHSFTTTYAQNLYHFFHRLCCKDFLNVCRVLVSHQGRLITVQVLEKTLLWANRLILS